MVLVAAFSKKSKDKSREFTVKAAMLFRQVENYIAYRIENTATGGLGGYPNEYDYPKASRNSFSSSFSCSQSREPAINVKLLLDIVYQHVF